MENHNVSPFQTLPPVVVAVAAILFAGELLLQAAALGLVGGAEGVGWRLDAIRDYAVFDSVAHEMWDRWVFPRQHLLRFLAYPLIHGGFVHVMFVCVFVLALGKMVAQAFSPLSFLALFVGGSIFGALGHVIILDSQVPLIGGFPGAYGLIGGFTFIMWTKASVRGDNQYRAFGLISILLGIQLLFGVIQGEFGNVVAEISGFSAGFLISFVVSPGGWRRILNSVRSR